MAMHITVVNQKHDDGTVIPIAVVAHEDHVVEVTIPVTLHIVVERRD